MNLTAKEVKLLDKMLDKAERGTVEYREDIDMYVYKSHPSAKNIINIFLETRRHLNRKKIKRKHQNT